MKNSYKKPTFLAFAVFAMGVLVNSPVMAQAVGTSSGAATGAQTTSPSATTTSSSMNSTTSSRNMSTSSQQQQQPGINTGSSGTVGSTNSASGTAGNLSTTTNGTVGSTGGSSSVTLSPTGTVTSINETALNNDIRNQVQADRGISNFSRNNYRVTTANNQVYIRGTARTTAEKERIGAIVRQSSSGATVVNELQISNQ